MREFFRKAVLNICKHGDTDIFPFPFERYLFQDRHDDVLKLLNKIYVNEGEAKKISELTSIVELSQTGYYGFRKATLIEPFWNAYYLGLVISFAKEIEEARIPIEEEIVFSYRYNWEKKTYHLFGETNWKDYKRKCIELSKDHQVILQTDIADYYSRINHHRLENCLQRIENKQKNSKRIINILGALSHRYSSGIPVGGPASRLLSELALNDVDHYLLNKGIKYCRYADDYTIFCESESDAYKNLIFLSEKLANDVLVLQKGKTKILSSDEFREINKYLDPQPINDEQTSDQQKLLNISIRFDPYSPTANEDYEKIKEDINKINIIEILAKEVNKTAIDQTVTKQAINAINALVKPQQSSAVKILLDPNNLTTLSPVFTLIMRCIRHIYEDLSSEDQDYIDNSLHGLFEKSHFIAKININVNYMIQVLSFRHTQWKEQLFIRLYEDDCLKHLLRRQIIVALANWKTFYWLTDQKTRFQSMNLWERRAVLYATFKLGEEGEHWRENKIKHKQFDEAEQLMVQWFEEREKLGKKILI